MYISWCEYEENDDEKKKIISKGIEQFPTDSHLLYYYLKGKVEDMSNNKTEDLIQDFEKVLKNIEASESYDIWNLCFEFLKKEADEGHVTNEHIEEIIKKNISSIKLDQVDYENFMLLNYLNWANETYGITKIREIYKE